MTTQATLDEITQKIVRQAQGSLGGKLDKVILYGSYARGDYDAESDIDIMILADVPRDETRDTRRLFNGVLRDIDDEYEYEYLISLQVVDCATFYKFADDLPYYRNVLKDGVALYAS